MEENIKKIKELVTEKINQNKILIYVLIIIIVIIVFFIVIVFYYFNNRTENIEYNENLVNELNIENNKISDENIKEESKIKVHITGEVRNPGLYELEEGSRILDIINLAGGITPEANLDKVNLAYQISDGQKVKIPSIKDEEVGNYIFENSGENVIEEDKNNTKIDINKADLNDLITLSGIGESTAQKIIDYREKNGKFKKIEDIKNVSGIGESKYNQIKDYIKAK